MKAIKTRERLLGSIGRIHHADREIVSDCIKELDEIERLAGIGALRDKEVPAKVNCIVSFISLTEGSLIEYDLTCPVCKNVLGRINEEDCYEIYEKYCSGCGQSIYQSYTEEDIKTWMKQSPDSKGMN